MIFSGVVMFWNVGLYGIVLVIFIVSVVVLCMKFFVIGMLFVMMGWYSVLVMCEWIVLYCVVELIGYWLMFDVLVVVIICVLVRFGLFFEIELCVGILFFGMVVIFMMLFVMSFDLCFIWDVEKV